LTKKLIAIVDKPLVLLEKDETLVPHLQQFIDPVPNVPENTSQNSKVELLLGDALAVDLASLLSQKGRNPSKTIVVGNLPYYITSPLITKFF
jgi:16S rRNA A1518/A1519 N6-dimethyltransferase RsmA/KsgA/DIM1 with predicted DNA glycosylase/AP lyase activity